MRNYVATTILVLLCITFGLLPRVVVARKHRFAHHHHDRGTVYDDSNEALVNTDTGPVLGVVSDSVRVFMGIPFAQPPVGQLRWKSPQPPTSWAPNVLKAQEFKPACPQVCILPPSLCPNVTNEDCLYLNVFTPRVSYPSEPLPVMVFIAGGAFVQGTGSSLLYDGSYLANATNTIIVTFNYRLGALGFYVSGDGTIVGNQGLQDQRAVLEWVQRNIASFGGDPTKVTLFGESAGALSTCIHLITPLSAGLFRSAIMESSHIGLPLKTNAEMVKYTDKLASKLGCKDSSDMACLMQKSADDIANVANSLFVMPDPFSFTLDFVLMFAPTIDGSQVPLQPITAFEQGQFTKVPVILGTNRDEGIMFIYGGLTKPFNFIEYKAALVAVFHADNYDTIEEMYPAPNSFSVDTRPVLSELTTDYVFTCAVRNIAESLSKQVPTYWYNFRHPLSFDPWGPLFQYCQGYVCHGAELPFVFNSASDGGFSFTPEEQQLAYTMAAYWSNFAHSDSGNPNEPSSPNAYPTPVMWPQFDAAGTPEAIIFDVPTVYINDTLLVDQCNMWDKLGFLF